MYCIKEYSLNENKKKQKETKINQTIFCYLCFHSSSFCEFVQHNTVRCLTLYLREKVDYVLIDSLFVNGMCNFLIHSFFALSLTHKLCLSVCLSLAGSFAQRSLSLVFALTHFHPPIIILLIANCDAFTVLNNKTTNDDNH